MGFAVAGNFVRKWGMTTTSDYSWLGISREQSANFFKLLSIDLPSLRVNLGSSAAFNEDWMYTWNPLESKPLIFIDPKVPDQILCPLPRLLLRRITTGLYYDLKDARGFANPFGEAFQAYVGDVVSECCPADNFQLVPEQQYYVGNDLKHGVDWIVTDCGANLFIECKTKRLTRDAKFLLQGHALSEQLQKMANAIVQNYKNINDAISGKSNWTPNGNPGFSLIVTLEDWFFVSVKAQDQLVDIVLSELEKNGLPVDILKRLPYTIMSIDEFESACQVIAEIGIHALFSKKTDDIHLSWGMTGFIQTEFEAINLRKRHIFMKDWETLEASILSTI
ncbi:MAG: hypothetical protein NVSMB28_04950 [Collimonas sp.]